MANIAVVDYCNLKCPYCFANDYIIEEERQVITLDQLDRILEFLSRSSCGRIGIIGGEPTLHPEFSTILSKISEFCEEKDLHASIFTNGIHIGDYARQVGGRIGGLININHPDVIGETNWKLLKKSLDRLKLCSVIDKFSFGVNLYHTLDDYDYIFELALLYNKEQIRVSYVAPTCDFSEVDKTEYYTEAKKIFIPFVEKAKSKGIRLHIDCNHIPRCYFSDEELALIDIVVDGFHSYCEPVVDITPDFRATACFGAYELFELDKFNDIQEVERYLRFKKLYPLSQLNSSGNCSTCEKFENLSCQGGCLAFSNK